MKVYVCVNHVAYQGFDDPAAVFDSEEKAKDWVAKETPNSGWDDPMYFEMEVQ